MQIPAVKIKVRWSDLDANMHLGNSSYMNFTSYARVELMSSVGITIEEMKRREVGPIIFYENFSFFKEISPQEDVYVTAELSGMSDEGGLFEFTHNFYNINGDNLTKSYLLGSWIDFKTRKRAILSDDWKKRFKNISSPSRKKLTIEDVKKLPYRPEKIDIKNLVIIQ